MPEQSEIILINIPFSDLKSTKRRPVVVISKNEYNNKQNDIIVAAITSNITSKDYTVEFDNDDMKQGTLPKKSCVRADKIYSLDKSLIIKKFGVVSDDIMAKTINMISEVLSKPEINEKQMSSCVRSINSGNENHCKCTFTDCDKWGKCCSCVLFHRTKGGLPGCFFTEAAEKTGNRDVDYFIKNVGVPLKETN